MENRTCDAAPSNNSGILSEMNEWQANRPEHKPNRAAPSPRYGWCPDRPSSQPRPARGYASSGSDRLTVRGASASPICASVRGGPRWPRPPLRATTRAGAADHFDSGSDTSTTSPPDATGSACTSPW